MRTPEKVTEEEAMKVTHNPKKILTLSFGEKCIRSRDAEIAKELRKCLVGKDAIDVQAIEDIVKELEEQR